MKPQTAFAIVLYGNTKVILPLPSPIDKTDTLLLEPQWVSNLRKNDWSSSSSSTEVVVVVLKY